MPLHDSCGPTEKRQRVDKGLQKQTQGGAQEIATRDLPPHTTFIRVHGKIDSQKTNEESQRTQNGLVGGSGSTHRGTPEATADSDGICKGLKNGR